MAQAESIMAAKFNKPDCTIVDHYTYCLAGDGCLMEGISYEAASLAGHWKLGKLIVLYDSNNISIEGNTSIAFSDDIQGRFESMGWHVMTIDGFNTSQVTEAIKLAKTKTDRPSIIVCKTIIGWGSPKAGSQDSHGSPLGEKGLAEFKQKIGWDTPSFEIPDAVKKHMTDLKQKSQAKQNEWQQRVDIYKSKYASDYAELQLWLAGKHNVDPSGLDSIEHKEDASRNVSGKILNQLAKMMPNFLGGSADLASSNKTSLSGLPSYQADSPIGRNFHYGVREHAMVAIANGMTLHAGLVNYVSTFLVFSDYARGAIRMSSIMNLPSLFVLTHDSIGVGEDGGTHQPIEQISSLRSIPNLKVFRPADSRETVAAYKSWLKDNAPYAMILSRQNLPLIENSGDDALKGGYTISPSKKAVPQAILIATGSELQYAIVAQNTLREQGIDTSVVSMPCCELFDAQPESYKAQVLPDAVRARVACEAGSATTWFKYVGIDGKVVGIDTFGLSGKAEELFLHYGFCANKIVNEVLNMLKN